MTFFSLLLAMFILLCACGGNAASTTPTPEATENNGAAQALPKDEITFAEAKPAAHIPEEVTKQYVIERQASAEREKKAGKNEYIIEGYDPVFLLIEPQLSFYMPLTLPWVLVEEQDTEEGGKELLLYALYDASHNTQIILRLQKPKELPWLTVIPENGVNILSVNFEEVIKHTPAYFEAYVKEMLTDKIETVTEKPKLMQFSCCTGGIIDFTATIDGLEAKGTYAVWGSDEGFYEVFLIVSEKYFDVAYEDLFFFLSNSGHGFRDAAEVKTYLGEMQKSQPKR